jgi:hypothetical protein
MIQRSRAFPQSTINNPGISFRNVYTPLARGLMGVDDTMVVDDAATLWQPPSGPVNFGMLKKDG